jgi:hypothetical protein
MAIPGEKQQQQYLIQVSPQLDIIVQAAIHCWSSNMTSAVLMF